MNLQPDVDASGHLRVLDRRMWTVLLVASWAIGAHRLTGDATYSWWAVLIPLWIPGVVLISVLLLLAMSAIRLVVQDGGR
jgi:hypothetical protein